MSLTQERINDIALASFEEEFGYRENTEMLIAAFNLFLSRIREEQEAVAEVKEGHLANWLQWKSEELMSIIPIGTQLFAIPQAAPESNAVDCSELVEALEKLSKYPNAFASSISKHMAEEATKALVKHKASMGEKE